MSSYRTCATGLLVGVLGVGTAMAQPAKLQREFQEGVDAYRLGEYDDARKHLENARAIDPSLPGPHRFLAAVALAEHRYSECVESATRALRAAPTSSESADTRRLHEECRVADGRPRFLGAYGGGGAISLRAIFDGEPCAAAVTIDRHAAGSTPVFPRAIPSGTHELVFTLAGAKPARTQVHVLRGVVTDVEVTLTSATAPAAGWLVLPKELLKRADVVLLIDGEVAKRAPRIELAPGAYQVEVRRGRERWAGSLEIESGAPTSVRPVFRAKSSNQAKKPKR
ncbi:MAG: PEGA domain-containing protein [Kofleriaceae bacterium]